MKYPEYLSWVEINKSNLFNNIKQYKQIIGNNILAIVVKSNAYGHGFLEISKLCQENNNVDWLCVINLSEALVLREAGVTKSILVLSYINDNIELAILNNIDLVIYDLDFAINLNLVAKKLNKKANIHIKIDTGLSRLGINYNSALEFILHIKKLDFININGIFTHFAESEKSNSLFTKNQIEKFDNLILCLEQNNIFIRFKHYSCSAAITSIENHKYNFFRLGLGIYGLWPSLDNKTNAQKKIPELNLLPVLAWKTKIIQIKEVESGSYIGYGRTFQVKVDSKIAVLPVGYWEGYDRKLSNNSKVIINNQSVPIIGQISMNIMTIDITNVQDVYVGQEITLLGLQDEVSADLIAKNLNTINWEIVTRINPLLPRIVVNNFTV